MGANLFIIWNVNPDFLDLGKITIRWYGVLYAVAFYVGYRILKYVFKAEKVNQKELDSLSWHLAVGLIIGARIGYLLINQPVDLFNHPFDIIIIWQGGLSAFGGAIGAMIATLWYSRKKKTKSFLWIMDRLVLPVSIGGSIVRLGNLMNSEIYGRPTTAPWGFKFVKNLSNVGKPIADVVPRHPTQLYQSIIMLALFLFLFNLYKRKRKELASGMLLGLFLVLIFLIRFFMEYFNEVQTPYGNSLTKQLGLNFSQVLCIPFIILGIFFTLRAKLIKRSL